MDDGLALLVAGVVLMALALCAFVAGEFLLARRQRALRERYQLPCVDMRLRQAGKER
ncbi:MAG: hypothetical protein LBL86_08320 [Coriobacteriales bacterium]|jgi:hypothetical protein|nr:hypothetical protein [Coriobacteriales bacterium]